MTASSNLPGVNGDASGKTLPLASWSLVVWEQSDIGQLEKHELTSPPSARPDERGRQSDVWKHAPVLVGTTKFEPRSDVKNIMITGGAGFM